jgi:acetoin utilization deacetylase AcuC-like enzyme
VVFRAQHSLSVLLFRIFSEERRMSRTYSRRHFLADISHGLGAAACVPLLYRTVDAQQQHPPSYSTGYFYDNICLQHQHTTETPQRIRWIDDRMRVSGLHTILSPLPPLDDPLPFIKYIHNDTHINKILGEIPGHETTGPSALRAAAGVLGAVKAVREGTVRNAFCAIRPPGHHSHLDMGWEEGFCFFSNVAIAAEYARREYGYKKILIIDWDYHHGNGTQYFFYDDPGVLFFSTHNADDYPGRFRDTYRYNGEDIAIGSDPSCTGVGPGEGFTINVHCREHITNEEMESQWDEYLMKKADEFGPDFVMISAGFDSKKDDELGVFDLTETGFAALTRKAMDIADKHCEGRLVSALEGGYADSGAQRGDERTYHNLASCAVAHVATLRGVDWQDYKVPVSIPSLPFSRSSHSPVLSNGILHIPPRLHGKIQSVELLNVSGQKVGGYTGSVVRNGTVDLRQYTQLSGMLFVRLVSREGRETVMPFGF